MKPKTTGTINTFESVITFKSSEAFKKAVKAEADKRFMNPSTFIRNAVAKGFQSSPNPNVS